MVSWFLNTTKIQKFFQNFTSKIQIFFQLKLLDKSLLIVRLSVMIWPETLLPEVVRKTPFCTLVDFGFVTLTAAQTIIVNKVHARHTNYHLKLLICMLIYAFWSLRAFRLTPLTIDTNGFLNFFFLLHNKLLKRNWLCLVTFYVNVCKNDETYWHHPV